MKKLFLSLSVVLAALFAPSVAAGQTLTDLHAPRDARHGCTVDGVRHYVEYKFDARSFILYDQKGNAVRTLTGDDFTDASLNVVTDLNGDGRFDLVYRDGDHQLTVSLQQPDGTFRLRDVQRYMASLPTAGTPDALVRKAADRQRRKEEADIRKAEAAAEREEFDLQVKKGRYIRRDQVYAELAARAVTLSSGLKTAFESQNLDLVSLVDGNPKKAAALVEALERICDDALNEYSREMEFEVVLEDLERAAEEVTDEQE